MKGWPKVLALGAAFGLVGVAAGAFGAHGLRDSVSERMLEVWETAARYELVHAVILAAIGLFASSPRPRSIVAAAWLFSAGILIFSGSLYALVLGGPKILGAVTPIGGLCLIGGWLCLVIAGLAKRNAA